MLIPHLSSLDGYGSKPFMGLLIRSTISLYRTAYLLVPVLLVSSIVVAGETPASPPFHEGQVLEARTGQAIPFDDFLGQVAAQDVVYLGEEHQNRSHVEAAVRILEGLLAKHRQPILALEMFSWDGQTGIDRYVSGEALSKADFLQESHWEENWGGGFENYEPLVTFAREHRLSVLALNPPRSLVRLVAGKGMAQALTSSEMDRWGMKNETFAEDPAYREMIVEPLRQCHGGMSDDRYQRMYEASVFRDEGMAKTIAVALRQIRVRQESTAATNPNGSRPGPIVSYTGGGHIQYYLPVPHRVLRRISAPVKQVSIYLAALEPGREDEIREYLRNGIADYVWVTALGAHGVPKRCK